METIKKTIIIRDNDLTDELRDRCSKLIDCIVKMPLNKRRSHYEELNSMLINLCDNKNKNYEDFIKKMKDLPILYEIEIATIRNNEAEEYIKKIFNILTGPNECK